ncbi:MAG: group intron reverse transcriptase/maturase [Alphaproteobacteria bacterium]|nr:group intron reverse transcriptase/maturase [Alphaproteobacteria bacterium]
MRINVAIVGGIPISVLIGMHYTFDKWMERQFAELEFCRYADDGLIHCKSKIQAEYVKEKLLQRLVECGLELNESKTNIVYCKDKLRKVDYPMTRFDFFGYTFKPRLSFSSIKKEYFVNFSPAIIRSSIKATSQEMKGWKINLRSSQALEDFARMYNPVLRGWWQYYGCFYKSAMTVVFNQFNRMLVKWVMKNYRKLRNRKTQASQCLQDQSLYILNIRHRDKINVYQKPSDKF